MNALTEIFPAGCLTFGFLCAVVALIADHAERRRLNRAAALRRVYFTPGRRIIFQEDGKPLCYEDDEQ